MTPDGILLYISPGAITNSRIQITTHVDKTAILINRSHIFYKISLCYPPFGTAHYIYFVSWCGFSYAHNVYKDFWIGETAEKNGSLLASLEMIVSLPYPYLYV